MDLEYTIQSFDAVNKVVTVNFDDGGWAEIRLMNPLPKNKTELEDKIKRFTRPVEVVEAQTNPDADLNYISSLVGVPQTCTRFRMNNPIKPEPVDPEVEARLKMWEETRFQQRVGDALVKLGVVATNPMTTPDTNV